MSELQKVWVVMPTDYDEYGIDGIFDSLEAAKASCPEVVEWHQNGEEWTAPGRHHLCIYADKVKTLAYLSDQARQAAETRAGEREQMRAEVRVPLPYE